MTILLYWPAAEYDLVNLDDISYVVENQLIHDGLTLRSIKDALTSIYQVMWAPGLWISYMLDVEIFGATPWGFHLTNILLHTCNTLLVYVLFVFWTRSPWQAFIATAFWSWHPLRVEGVAWVSARKDVLSGFFFLLCLGFYYWAHHTSGTREQDRPLSQSPPRQSFSRMALVLSWTAMACGITVKPVLVTAPAVMLLIDAWPLKRFSVVGRLNIRGLTRLVLEKWPFWLLTAASAFIAVYAHSAGTSLLDIPLLKRLAILPINYSFYLLKTVDPRHLTVLYGSFDFNLTDITVSLFFLIVFSALFWVYRDYSVRPLIGWLWFLGVMLPTSGVLRFGVQSLADRFTYLPAIGFSIILLALFVDTSRKSIYLRYAFCVLVIMLLVFFTHKQLPVWRNSEQLYANLLKHSPNHGFALSDQASRIWRQGQVEEALALITRAVESPTHSDTQRIMKAEMLAAVGRPEIAREYLLGSSWMSPGSSAGLKYFALAMISNQLDDHREALIYTERAVRTLSPHDTLYRDLMLLGMSINYCMDDQEAAVAWAQEIPAFGEISAIELSDLLPYYIGQWKRLQRVESVQYFRELLAAEPEAVGAIINMAWLMATADWSPMPAEEIVEYARNAHKLAPANPVILDTLGTAYAHAGEFDVAITQAEKARERLRALGQSDSEFYRQISARIALFQQQQPWRDETVADRLLGSFYSGNNTGVRH